ncbi:FG-GAP repeat domain-containing protein [Alteromonas sp. ASW11-130]|uniref:FG-GAP repeat domain-containing protein n=1 Tax=Alteromonas sp. ASW11-130 TaxID=3015775 RepID=UPI0022427806|nr:VCBS repeat-containing protein [Alteromonas sp. ASW11-130]MCW8091549.1 VCBS repeat-containing protein [Alteromonas sp. ASW11-130]
MMTTLPLIGCGGGSSDSPTPAPTPSPTPTTPSSDTISSFFSDVSDTLPSGLDRRCMDGEAVDIDNDGDLDLVLAIEFGTNIILINDGSAQFSFKEGVPVTRRDSEDIAAADFDGDGDIDIFFATEDDVDDELWINNGNGAFSLSQNQLPSGVISNSALALDVNNDGTMDLVLGNAGNNFVWLNDGKAFFTSSSINAGGGVTQDIKAGDIDGDGDQDLIVGNEKFNQLLINNGDGTFSDESDARLPLINSETRDIELGDIDNDGDLDMYVSNVSFFQDNSSKNYLLLNDGAGVFTEVETPPLHGNNVDSSFVDLNRDGLLDIITVTAGLNDEIGNSMTLENLGDTKFENSGFDAIGNGFDIVVADFNGDEKVDMYFCNRIGSANSNNNGGGEDQLFIGK